MAMRLFVAPFTLCYTNTVCETVPRPEIVLHQHKGLTSSICLSVLHNLGELFLGSGTEIAQGALEVAEAQV